VLCDYSPPFPLTSHPFISSRCAAQEGSLKGCGVSAASGFCDRTQQCASPSYASTSGGGAFIVDDDDGNSTMAMAEC
jgi:hypothetical protein